MLDQLRKEMMLSRLLVAAFLNHDIEHIAMLVDRPARGRKPRR